MPPVAMVPTPGVNHSLLYQVSFSIRLSESRLSRSSMHSRPRTPRIGRHNDGGGIGSTPEVIVMTPRMVPVAALAGLLVLFGVSVRWTQAQEPSVAEVQAAKIRELERKVQELEEIVRRVEAKASLPQSASPPAAPAGAQTFVLSVNAQEGTNPVPQDMPRPQLAESGSTGAQAGRGGLGQGFFHRVNRQAA